ncbi:MAG: hypothetical protein ACE5MI_14020 [Acidimicrobiia bacterium]
MRSFKTARAPIWPCSRSKIAETDGDHLMPPVRISRSQGYVSVAYINRDGSTVLTYEPENSGANPLSRAIEVLSVLARCIGTEHGNGLYPPDGVLLVQTDHKEGFAPTEVHSQLHKLLKRGRAATRYSPSVIGAETVDQSVASGRG